MQLTLPDTDATEKLGAALAPHLEPGLVVFLSGDLGAGKTTLTRGLLRALGVSGRVKSPTYSLVELYTVSSLNLYHFDFYRFSESSEWSDAGFRDLFGGDNVCLIEWPEKAAGQLPPPDLWIRLAHDQDRRSAIIEAQGERGNACLAALSATPFFAGHLPGDSTTF
jgi:tRNA threonylcarbamoyladenosine biosynthesis protein TsaE